MHVNVRVTSAFLKFMCSQVTLNDRTTRIPAFTLIKISRTRTEDVSINLLQLCTQSYYLLLSILALCEEKELRV